MFKPSFMEVNRQPSALITNVGQGVPAALQSQLINEPHFDGQTIEGMRDNPLYSHHSNIDKIGLAQKKIAEAAQVVSKSKFVRQLNRSMSHPAKPK